METHLHLILIGRSGGNKKKMEKEVREEMFAHNFDTTIDMSLEKDLSWKQWKNYSDVNVQKKGLY